jgi:crotonobetainyl-CoA:carnitine CoA-transferase CaiB-like acyl-CoA transferase
MTLLRGIRVVEAASMLLVPCAAAIMADYGADVIKVEPPEGDENRRMHELPGLPDSDIPYSFLMDNRSKRAIALNLKESDGLAALHRLVAGADVFLTNFRMAARRRLRITYEDLAPLNPRLVYASASGFGETGPEAEKPAYDTVVYWSRSGLESSLMSAEGALGRIPPGSGDHPSGVALFAAVVLALFARERTGRGANVSTSLLANGAWSNATNIQARLCGASFYPKVPRERAVSFSGVYYRTRDGRALKFSFVNPAKLWPRFCRAVNRPDFMDDPRFATPDARRRHAADLITILDAIFADRDAEYWQSRLTAHDLPFGIVCTHDDVVADPQMQAAGVFVPLEHPRLGNLATVDSPFRVDGVEKAAPRAAPEVGEHTNEILASLGYGPDEVAALLARGAAVQAATKTP